MSLEERISDDLKEAMRSKDSVRLSTIRLIRTAIINAHKERPRELSEQDVLDLIGKEAKKRRDSIEQYSRAGRGDLASREAAELAILEGYLPKQLSREEIEEIVRPVVEELPERSPSQMGAVMREVMPKMKGRADGRQVNEIVRSLLG